jgi:hypothetical protein
VVVVVVVAAAAAVAVIVVVAEEEGVVAVGVPTAGAAAETKGPGGCSKAWWGPP